MIETARTTIDQSRDISVSFVRNYKSQFTGCKAWHLMPYKKNYTPLRNWTVHSKFPKSKLFWISNKNKTKNVCIYKHASFIWIRVV